MNPVNLLEAYAAVYDEELREEVLHVEENYEVIDELSDNELDEIVEEVILEESFDIDECVEYIEEAKVTYGHDTEDPAAKRRAERMDRVKSAAKRVGKAAVAKAKEKAPEIKAAAKKVVAKAKEKAPEVKSAAKKAVKGILSKGKELFNKGRSALAKGLRKGSELASKAAAKVEPKKAEPKAAAPEKAEPKREAKPYRGEGAGRREVVGKSVRAAAKEAIKAARDTTHRGGGVGRKETASSGGVSSRGGSIGREGKKGTALPAASTTKSGKPLNKGNYAMRSAQHNQRLSKRLGEEYEIIAALMLEDIIDKGLAETYEEAFEIMEGLTDYEIGEISENFEFLAEEILTEQVEDRDDLFDYILEYLVAEGYADTNENALVIMANMSEEWRQEIIEADSLAAMQARREKRLAAQRKREGRPSGGGDFGHDYSKPHEQAKKEREERMKKFINKED
ncbi:MAG: hypothetical protein ACO3CQ_00400 [Candidatus Nanopelagicaceae bacterium]